MDNDQFNFDLLGYFSGCWCYIRVPTAYDILRVTMNQQLSGILFGLAAFTTWGFLPVYWKQLHDVVPFEIICHRIVWSCLFLCLIISFQHRWSEVRQIASNSANLKKLCGSGLLIGLNWFIYIWAVNTEHVIETSLGYYITPMVNILLGFLLLGEKFNRLQLMSILCALAGVSYSLLAYGDLPLFALTLAFTFAFYGYARKKIQVAPIPGLLIETCVLLIPALAYICYRQIFFGSLFFVDLNITLWLVGAGVATSLPLLWFAAAARKLKLSTVGILQYLAPTIAFTLGVFVYREPFDWHSGITFTLIWLGVFIYCADSIVRTYRF
ncbi:chloramphenicol-sensitive protein RarD [Desulfuromusa kysingii]|uniref:Chloramphenicol-sensitive protein RarD n=1 Tax=Desulfuromusa kysingii TaxID=37625 RepID=A0A1H3XED4_9BACT|nr:EamA family transporter RarD [Desulfuromusa kysingii]SDZ97775.1 chloramphenicol-sensitive protein RarD [Desulfuromusa kysingii]